jgi:hypothetical protein
VAASGRKNNPERRINMQPNEKHFTVTGFVVNRDGTKLLMEFHNKPAHIHMDLVYLCVADEVAPAKKDDEVNDVKWMTQQEVLDSGTFESIKEFAKQKLGEGQTIRS